VEGGHGCGDAAGTEAHGAFRDDAARPTIAVPARTARARPGGVLGAGVRPAASGGPVAPFRPQGFAWEITPNNRRVSLIS